MVNSASEVLCIVATYLCARVSDAVFFYVDVVIN